MGRLSSSVADKLLLKGLDGKYMSFQRPDDFRHNYSNTLVGGSRHR